jgi:hypothetical protein
MKIIAFNTSITIDLAEYCSRDFIQGMLDRMLQSHYKYGRVKDNYPEAKDAIGNLKTRLELYAKTGNTEFLMDVANFAMIEFMAPAHPKAHFKVVDSNKTRLL